jgi:P27 family predicted phage terminase small subunit
MPQRRHAPELQLLHGVDKNELVDDRPKPARREPSAPATLSVPERKIWAHVTAELREMDMLASADLHELVVYCETVALCQRIHEQLSKAQSLINTNVVTNVARAHPLIGAYDRAVGRAHMLASALGLNPHGRSLIHGRTTAKPNTEAANVKELYA